MKAKYWIFLWVFLLLLELLTYWIVRDRFHRLSGSSFRPDPELLALADETYDQWVRLGGAMPLVPVRGREFGQEEDMLRCQSLLLQLKDLEAVLRQDGSELSLAGDMQGWLHRASPGQGEYPVFQYINNLVGWLGRFSETGDACRLERASLHPGTKGDLPSLSFELSGNPLVMGRNLLLLETDDVTWRLDELDIVREDESRAWWMRGSLSFADGNATR